MQLLSLDKLKELLVSAGGSVARYVALAAAVLVALWIVRELFRRRKPAAPLPGNLKIDVATLPETGPPMIPPILEFYNVPVRLAAIVLAPAGRVRELPPADQLGPLLDAIVPGLDKVVRLHRPMVRRWPSQLSVRGFAHVFFSNVRLPGDAGKDTPWSSVAGVFKHENQPVMAGLVLRAAKPNSLVQTIVESEDQWLGCLQIKRR
jgi:hypothetical protein